MKDSLNLWLSQNARVPGVLACGLQYPDRTSFTQPWAEGFESSSVEKSLTCLGDIWRLLRVQRISARWIRWKYARSFVYFSQRQDGISLELIVARETTSAELKQVKSLLEEFQSVSLGQDGVRSQTPNPKAAA